MPYLCRSGGNKGMGKEMWLGFGCRLHPYLSANIVNHMIMGSVISTKKITH